MVSLFLLYPGLFCWWHSVYQISCHHWTQEHAQGVGHRAGAVVGLALGALRVPVDSLGRSLGGVLPEAHGRTSCWISECNHQEPCSFNILQYSCLLSQSLPFSQSWRSCLNILVAAGEKWISPAMLLTLGVDGHSLNHQWIVPSHQCHQTYTGINHREGWTSANSLSSVGESTLQVFLTMARGLGQACWFCWFHGPNWGLLPITRCAGGQNYSRVLWHMVLDPTTPTKVLLIIGEFLISCFKKGDKKEEHFMPP